MFQHILAPLDGSLLAEGALPHVVALAKAFTARVTLLHVLECQRLTEGDEPLDLIDWEMRKREAHAYLNAHVDQLQTLGVSTAAVLLEGQPAACMIHFIHQSDVDLIVLSTHGGSGLSAWNVSSIAQKILMRAHRSIILVRADPMSTVDLANLHYTRLLVPLDGSQRAECALPVAQRLAQYYQAQLLLAHLVQKPEIPQRLRRGDADLALADSLTARNCQVAEAYLEGWQAQLGGDTQARILASEDIAFTLHELVATEQVDLVVMSAHGYAGKNRWPYGSLTTSFLLYGNTPLLAVQDLASEDWAQTQREMASEEHSGH